MRKITDLKENECIEIRSKKNLKKLSSMTGYPFKPTHYNPTYMQKVGSNGWSYGVNPDKETIILPTSEFLPKKNKVKKRLKALESKVDTLIAKECVVKQCEQVKEQPKEIDWSVSGQILKSQSGSYIITTGNHSKYLFSGTMLTTGEYSGKWVKSLMSVYKGKLELKNTLCNE